MAFVWIPVSAGKIAVTTHVNEAKDNVDTLADNLGVAQYSWSEMPVAADEQEGQVQIQELQDSNYLLLILLFLLGHSTPLKVFP